MSYRPGQALCQSSLPGQFVAPIHHRGRSGFWISFEIEAICDLVIFKIGGQKEIVKLRIRSKVQIPASSGFIPNSQHEFRLPGECLTGFGAVFCHPQHGLGFGLVELNVV